MTEHDSVYRVFCGCKLFECAACDVPLKEHFDYLVFLASFDDLQLECGYF